MTAVKKGEITKNVKNKNGEKVDVSTNAILEKMQKAYSERSCTPTVITFPEKLSNSEMWAQILASRIDNMREDRALKYRMYLDVLTTCCELYLWDPPSPGKLLELLNN